jgi:hypothetical protein
VVFFGKSATELPHRHAVRRFLPRLGQASFIIVHWASVVGDVDPCLVKMGRNQGSKNGNQVETIGEFTLLHVADGQLWNYVDHGLVMLGIEYGDGNPL